MAKPVGKLQHRDRTELNAQSLARSYTEMAIRSLATIAQRGKSEGARVAAADALLSRGWGRPQQSHSGIDGEGPITVEIVYRRDEPKMIEVNPNGPGPTPAT